MRHKIAVPRVMSGHFALVVGVKVGIGKQLLEASKAGVHWTPYKVDDLRVGQCRKNQWQVEIIDGQLVDKVGLLGPLFSGGF